MNNEDVVNKMKAVNPTDVNLDELSYINYWESFSRLFGRIGTLLFCINLIIYFTSKKVQSKWMIYTSIVAELLEFIGMWITMPYMAGVVDDMIPKEDSFTPIGYALCIIPFIIQLIIFIKLIINIIKSKKEGGTLNVKNRK